MDIKVLKMATLGVVGVSICLVLLFIPISWGGVDCGKVASSDFFQLSERDLGYPNLLLFGSKCKQLINFARTLSVLLGGIGACYLLRGFIEKRSS
tara:strand:+ start:637 stop:921 length:285 start_codon:yes stop_codon:yes gene_type:complete